MFVRIATISRKPGTSSTPPVPAVARGAVASSRWRAASRTLRRRLASEGGFTLIEVLVVAAILPVVIIATLGPFDFAQTQTPKNVEYAKSISDASAGLQQMMREVRQAYRVDETTPNSIRFNAIINSSDREIFYECDLPYPSNGGNSHYKEYRRCARVAVATGKSLPSISAKCPVVAPTPDTCPVSIDRLLNGTAEHYVFHFKDSQGKADATNPTYVEATILVPARGPLNAGLNHAIELNNGTALPNLLLSK